MWYINQWQLYSSGGSCSASPKGIRLTCSHEVALLLVMYWFCVLGKLAMISVDKWQIASGHMNFFPFLTAKSGQRGGFLSSKWAMEFQQQETCRAIKDRTMGSCELLCPL
uniref:Uncharacterized protein MANES_18G121900 n=1 Tax=Rhizophora mucronata TaxID=61149 RepID=A0A2P2LXK1_RHIMU